MAGILYRVASRVRNQNIILPYKWRVFGYRIFAHYRDLVDIVIFMGRFFKRTPTSDRVLGIINFNGETFGLGDAIAFQENLCVLKEQKGLQQVDICIVSDDNHTRSKIPIFDWQNQWNGKKSAIVQTAYLNPSVGNIFQFNNYRDFNLFRMKFMDRYIHFPNRRDQFVGDMRPIHKFFETYGHIPRLTADEASLVWARKRIMDLISPARLIVIQMRNSKSAARRNSNLPEWERFLKTLDPNRFKVVCIGIEEEIEVGWRDQNLVIFSKDLGADFLRDCALIQLSYLSLLPPSGMFVYALFAGNPYIVMNMPFGYWRNKKSVKFQLNGALEDDEQYRFQSKFQRHVWEPDTYENIKLHFDRLVHDLEKQNPYVTC